MYPRLLIDENLPPLYRTQLRLRDADLIVWRVGDPDAPPTGTLDPEILLWCERNDFLLITNNRHTMPPHLVDHLAEGRHIPGIVVLSPNIGIGRALEAVILIALASTEDEYRDQIVTIPL